MNRHIERVASCLVCRHIHRSWDRWPNRLTIHAKPVHTAQHLTRFVPVRMESMRKRRDEWRHVKLPRIRLCLLWLSSRGAVAPASLPQFSKPIWQAKYSDKKARERFHNLKVVFWLLVDVENNTFAILFFFKFLFAAFQHQQYHYYASPLNQTSAAAYCQKQGMKLLRPLTKAQYDSLKSNWLGGGIYFRTHVWTGMNRT